MKKKIAWIKWLIPAFFVLLALFFLTAVVGYSFSALVCLTIAGIVSLYYGLWALRQKNEKLGGRLLYCLSLLLCCGVIIVGLTGYEIFFAGHPTPEKSCDYILVLGCRVTEEGPSAPLEERIEAAYTYLRSHPETICVVSGGKGADEPMSEARCMFERLVQMGIDPQRVLLEERATSTWENIGYTLDLLEEQTGTRPTFLGLVSSDYHLYRAQMYAKACGIETQGIAAKTGITSLRINNYLREIAGVWHFIILGG